MENKPETEEWEDRFRKQFDELKLKPPQNSMPNVERELIIWFFRDLLATTRRDIVERLETEIEMLLETPHYNGEQTYERAIKEVLSIVTTITNPTED